MIVSPREILSVVIVMAPATVLMVAPAFWVSEPSGARVSAPPAVPTAPERVRLLPPVVVTFTSPPVVVTAPRGRADADVTKASLASLLSIRVLPAETTTPRGVPTEPIPEASISRSPTPAPPVVVRILAPVTAPPASISILAAERAPFTAIVPAESRTRLSSIVLPAAIVILPAVVVIFTVSTNAAVFTAPRDKLDAEVI